MKPTKQLSKSDQQINEAIKPILYADIFDYPLTFDEIYQFLEFKTTPQILENLLKQAVEGERLMVVDGFYSLSGRPNLVAKRHARWQAAQTHHPRRSAPDIPPATC